MPKSEKRQASIKSGSVKDTAGKTEDYFKRMFEQSTLGMAISDKTFHFIAANPAFCAMLGYTEAELTKLTFKDITHADNLGRDTESIQNLARGEIQSYKTEKRYIAKSGAIVAGSLTVTALHDASGNHVHSLVVLENITQRKLLEEALKESEEKFRNVFDNSTIGKSITYLDGSMDANPALCQMLGYAKEELSQQKWQSITHPDDVELTQNRMKQLQSGEKTSARFIKRFLKKDGSIIWVDLNSVLQKDKEGKPLYYITAAIDITARKKAEEALRESEENFRVLFDENPMPTLMSEMPSGRMNYVNKRLAESVGLKVEDMIGKPPNALGLLKDPADQEKLTRLISEKGYVDNVEFEKTFPDGSPGVVSISMRLVTVQGKLHCMTVIQDITARKQAEDALRASEMKYRELANLLPQTLFETDKDGNFTFANHAAFDIFGFSREDFDKGVTIMQVLVPEERARFTENLKKRYAGEKHQGNEYTLRRKDGSVFPVLTYTSVITADGNVAGLRGIVVDISYLRKTEKELAKLDKLESLGILAGGIAHDFNNLLTGIYGYMDLARSMSKDVRISEYLEAMFSTMKRAKSLTLQLLTFAKGGSPVQKITPLFPFIRETAQFALSGSNISCRFSLAENLRPCYIDKDQIAQVIDNIVINAQQAMPDGGAIEITAINISFRENEHAPLAKGDYVKVSIKDSGIGIPKEIMPRIFDPFYTTKLKGHGLGLATCFSIISRHGGCIDVESEPGKGSTFHIYLPASSETIVANAGTISKHKGSGTIIVMDDEEVVRDMFRQMLESMGYAVVCKNGGREAVDFYINEMSANRQIAAMIFDLTVAGGMGGMEAAAAIRKLDAGGEIPIFVASGYADNSVMRNPGEWGFTASISKPFTISDLSELLNKYLKA